MRLHWFKIYDRVIYGLLLVFSNIFILREHFRELSTTEALIDKLLQISAPMIELFISDYKPNYGFYFPFHIILPIIISCLLYYILTGKLLTVSKGIWFIITLEIFNVLSAIAYAYASGSTESDIPIGLSIIIVCGLWDSMYAIITFIIVVVLPNSIYQDSLKQTRGDPVSKN